ncbi:MAG: NADPH-dependent FMN reductase [Candidatus Methylacidiphilales bacterium]|nr:NADPH-dependent FMN reductase [Candidatus Methylacidiphilales bacterium]
MSIALVIGTNRPGSNTAKIAAHIIERYAAHGVTPEVLDLAHLPPSIFDTSSYETKPEAFKRFSDTIITAEGIHWVTPEYNGSVPGIAKYFIDMLQFPESFVGTPIAFTGLAAGIWGALRPIEQLQDIALYRNAHIFPGKVFIPGVFKVLGDDGKVKDEAIAKRLDDQVKGFIDFVATIGKK